MRVLALEYHDVVRDADWDESGFGGAAAASYKLSVADFDDHLEHLRRTGCEVSTRVPDVARSGGALPPVILTFDDGGSGYAAHAADRLERNGWRGCVFMTTGCIGKAGFLGAGELRSLAQRGHVIGTHSRNHPVRLSALPAPAILDEWRSSVADLEDTLGAAVRVGSVPGGYHSRVVAEAAAAAGLTSLFTSEPESAVRWINGCAVVGRFTLRQGDPGQLAARLVGRLPLARAAQWLQWNAKKAAKVVGGNAYLRVRERMLGR